MNIATTKEQCVRLLRSGMSADTADMYINNYDELWASPYKDNQRKYEKGFTPAWSLSKLLGLLPKEIKVDESPYDEVQKYGLLIYPFMDGWQVDYQYCEDDECHCLKCVHDTDPIEACVKAIEWLSANGYILNDVNSMNYKDEKQ